MKIESQRIYFRRLTLEDFDHMRELETEPDIMKFTPSRVPQTEVQTRTRLASQIANEATHSPLGVWAVETKDTKEFVGWFMLIKTDLKFPEVGFMIKKKFWRKGYASEALKALVDFAFNTLSLEGISARTTLHNVASIQTLEKLGFKLTHNITVPEKVLGGTVELKVFELKN